MVTTRRQSKDFEPVELPPVKHHKRKRSSDAKPSPDTAQPPSHSLSKRRKKVRSTAKVNTSPNHTESAPAAPPEASTFKTAKDPALVKTTESKARRQRFQGMDVVESKPSHTDLTRARKPAEVNLAKDSDSSDDDPAQRFRSVASGAADDEDADSRYALGPRRKGRQRPVAPIARRTAELKFEEDGLEEVDKAKVALTGAKKGTPAQIMKRGALPLQPVNGTKSNRTGPVVGPQVNGQSKTEAKPKKATFSSGIPSRTVMFVIAEAIAALSTYKDGTMSVPAGIDPQSRQPYDALETGEWLSYPVKGTYHLGALGRYGVNAIPPLPFSLTVPLSEHSIIEHTDTTTAEPSRQGLGFSSASPLRQQVPAVRRPNNYCFTWGKFRGRRIDSVPITYLRSIFNSDEYYADTRLQQAFADLYPKGLYESEAESFTFEKGGFKGKRFDEVPKSYIWGLLRKMNEGELVGGKKGRTRLERALEVWEQGQLDLTKD